MNYEQEMFNLNLDLALKIKWSLIWSNWSEMKVAKVAD